MMPENKVLDGLAPYPFKVSGIQRGAGFCPLTGIGHHILLFCQTVGFESYLPAMISVHMFSFN